MLVALEKSYFLIRIPWLKFLNSMLMIALQQGGALQTLSEAKLGKVSTCINVGFSGANKSKTLGTS